MSLHRGPETSKEQRALPSRHWESERRAKAVWNVPAATQSRIGAETPSCCWILASEQDPEDKEIIC